MENTDENNNVCIKKILDNTFLNLKMISEIRENDKLYVEDDLLKLDHPYFLQGIIRWFHNYSRNETMEYIDTIVDNINTIYDSISVKNKKIVIRNMIIYYKNY